MSLDSADLLDVLHYIFEKDLTVASPEEGDNRDRIRISLYERLYDKEYIYGSTAANNIPRDWEPENPEDDFSDIEPFDPLAKSKPPKAYTPTTSFNPNARNPYNGVLDAPLG